MRQQVKVHHCQITGCGKSATRVWMKSARHGIEPEPFTRCFIHFWDFIDADWLFRERWNIFWISVLGINPALGGIFFFGGLDLRRIHPQARCDTHIIHTGCGDRTNTCVNLSRGQCKPAGAANTNHTDFFTVHIWQQSKIVHRRTEVFNEDIRWWNIAWCTTGITHKRLVKCQNDKFALGQFIGIYTGCLFFDAAVWCANNQRRICFCFVYIARSVQIAGNFHPISVFIMHTLYRNIFTDWRDTSARGRFACHRPSNQPRRNRRDT